MPGVSRLVCTTVVVRGGRLGRGIGDHVSDTPARTRVVAIVSPIGGYARGVSAYEPDSTPIGWIGTGVMGTSMCGHLLAGGYPVTVYSRTRERAEPLLQRGATWADSPAQLATSSEIVFTMVGYPADVREVILGDDGVLSAIRPGGVIVDMTTSEPSLARELFDAAKLRGVDSVDAPVSGGDVGARNAALSIMVGGDEAASSASHRCWGCSAGRSCIRAGRGRPAHEDGQSDADRDRHDRGLRGAPLRPQGRARS